jgi:hypothetical protein
MSRLRPTKKYIVDRWYLVSNNGSAGNGQIDTYPFVDGGSLEKYGLVLDKYGTGVNEVSLTQEIERVDVPHLAGKTAGLSFSSGSSSTPSASDRRSRPAEEQNALPSSSAWSASNDGRGEQTS